MSTFLDVLAVLRAPLEMYPPSRNQLSLLAGAGLRVGVVECVHPDFPARPLPGGEPLRRIPGGRHRLLYREGPAPLPVRMLGALRYLARLRAAVRRHRPRLVLAYDMGGLLMASGARGRARLAVHFHELPAYRPGDGPGTGLARARCRANAARADLLVFPDRLRADLFRREARYECPLVVAANCPRRLDVLPDDRLRAEFPGLAASRVVYFQGFIGPSRCLDTVVRSMPRWPGDASLLAVGPVEPDYRAHLLDLAREAGVAGRVRLPGFLPRRRAYSVAVGADVACGLVRASGEENWRLSAGALNKRFEYLALGLPQVADDGPGVAEIVERRACGLLADPESPRQVGDAVRRILETPRLRAALSRHAREAHLAEYHYERQFAPALARIRALVEEAPAW